jgi:hypothetical protein
MERKTPTHNLEMSVPRTATLDLAGLVKLAYVLIGFATIAYFLMHLHAGGTMILAAEQASMELLYAVLALVLVFGVAVVSFAFRKAK